MSGAAPETPDDSPLTLDDAMASALYRDLMTAELEAAIVRELG